MHKAELKKIVLFFNEVDEIGLSNIRWYSLIYQRNNQNYEMLINVCYFVLDGMIQTTNKGNYKMMSFSDEHIHRLYEKFVLEYFKQHPRYITCILHILILNICKNLIHISRMKRCLVILHLHSMPIIFCIYY